ncbi:hypothetical protein AB0B45_13345 [Nonomuraea sp. NPDC049152]
MDPTATTPLFHHAEKVFGPVEPLVNNAGGRMRNTFLPDTP